MQIQMKLLRLNAVKRPENVTPSEKGYNEPTSWTIEMLR